MSENIAYVMLLLRLLTLRQRSSKNAFKMRIRGPVGPYVPLMAQPSTCQVKEILRLN